MIERVVHANGNIEQIKGIRFDSELINDTGETTATFREPEKRGLTAVSDTFHYSLCIYIYLDCCARVSTKKSLTNIEDAM